MVIKFNRSLKTKTELFSIQNNSHLFIKQYIIDGFMTGPLTPHIFP